MNDKILNKKSCYLHVRQNSFMSKTFHLIFRSVKTLFTLYKQSIKRYTLLFLTSIQSDIVLVCKNSAVVPDTKDVLITIYYCTKLPVFDFTVYLKGSTFVRRIQIDLKFCIFTFCINNAAGKIQNHVVIHLLIILLLMDA